VAVSSAYQNRPGNTQYGHPADICSVTVPLQAGKTVAEIQLPGVSTGVTNGQGALHVFSLAIGP
jgi:hypothetical protein